MFYSASLLELLFFEFFGYDKKTSIIIKIDKLYAQLYYNSDFLKKFLVVIINVYF